MIVNQNNYDYSIQYKKLFKEAFEILSNTELVPDDFFEAGRDRPSAVFTCLEEYFMYLNILSKLHAQNIEDYKNSSAEIRNAVFAKYSKFLMLPLDEEYFTINANSRTIAIPTNFVRYGVSLSGDQRAETLLFEIDRYFDFMDLVRTSVYIQWTSPSGIDGETAITLIDYNDKKIRFGWPLSAGIIDNYGTLKFSVRFFMTDPSNDKKIIYSFNTLPISVQIKQALRTTIGAPLYFDEDSIEFFRTAIKAGANSGAEKFPQSPIIFIDLPTTKQYLDSNNRLTLEVSACAIDQGDISYVWKRKQDNTTVVLPTGSDIDVQISYVKTNDNAYVPNKHYYTYIGEGAYDLVDSSTTAFDKARFFEQISRCSINNGTDQVHGTYYVEITNTVQNNPLTIYSKSVVVPAPKTITYRTDLQETGINNILPSDGSALVLRVDATPDDSNADISYEWYQQTDENTTKKLANTEKILEVSEPAWYYAIAKSTLNRASITEKSLISKITNEPVAPTIEGVTGSTVSIIVQGDDTQDIVVNASINNNDGLHNDLISDGMTYVWYHRKKDVVGDVQLEAVRVGQYGVVAIENNKLTVKHSGDDEVFVCTVTNILNDKTASSDSDYYKVSDL